MKYSPTRSFALSINKKLISVALASVFIISACGEESTSTNGVGFNDSQDTNTDFDQGKLITSIVDKVITPTYQQFSSLASEQQQAISNYCVQESALALGNSSDTLVNDAKVLAKESWQTAMNSWQQAEMMQFSQFLIDGGLRNNIYSWPTKNTCGVDLDVTYFKAGSVNGQPYNIATRTASRKSMVALEFLLFSDNLAHTCTGSTVPTQWNNQTEQYRKVARCEFASEVAADIKNNAIELLTAWQGSDGTGGYAAKLKSAGTVGSDFATQHDAVNKLSDAIFYLDNFTKDSKLAKPLGLFANECGSQACPESVESNFANHSITNITNNLQALKMFMQGSLTAGETDALGFSHYLTDVGDEVTAATINDHLALAIEETKNYQQSLASTLANDSDKVLVTHGDVKNITDKLKSDFITSLALELPKTSAGDND
ncbi:imelysin family protein [Colwellia psychrerythraea]|uniref:Peptidase M75, Imelysin n=1 Tax=Colwellia psychrerythraea TaxID=28229 RepID=A0A099KFM2_COLPS|nr:imelysin family protein [Colwellia psychrerythraea]KGJ89121.1 Peptidase M75, Imelysin [Colwellia psychrerythraea]